MELLGRDDVRDVARARAFEAFYRRHYGFVLAFAVRRLSDRETAREVALDVFRVVWRDYDAEAEPSPARLFTVARNLIGDVYRRQGREGRLLSALRADPGGRDVASSADLRVREVLEGMPAPAREVLVMKYWDGMAAGEIGALLGCSPGAVWVRLHRARQAFGAAWNRGAPVIEGREELA